MPLYPFGTTFDKTNFPPHKDPANEETGVAELYPERLQDDVNEYYNHDKVLPRVAGVDYTEESANMQNDDDATNAEEVSTFPHKY